MIQSVIRRLFILTGLVSSISLGCQFDLVQFEADFSGGRLNGCEQISAYEYRLWIEPENEPVNPSAWYGFKATAKTPQEIQIHLDYKGGKHRYAPKVSMDGKHWQWLAYDKKGDNAGFKLNLTNKPTWVAAQELLVNQDYLHWMLTLPDDAALRREVLGASTEGRDILSLTHKTESSKRWLVILGRQHPPEVTGAMALMPFVETLLADTKLGRQFRDEFNLFIVPIVNPDGVEKGHWRHNVGGVDLNRDWKVLSQLETQLLHNALQGIVTKGGSIEFALDFHSTWKNVFYTMPVDYGLKNAAFSDQWLASLDKALPKFKAQVRPGSNPDSGVFKQYIADTYGVHAVTYEVADAADRNELKQVANTAAELLMKQMLNLRE